MNFTPVFDAIGIYEKGKYFIITSETIAKVVDKFCFINFHLTTLRCSFTFLLMLKVCS